MFISHDDVDHTGNVNALMAAAPNATLVIDWFMQERMGATLDVPASRWRWVQDGDTLDVGDRTLQVVRPPVFDSGTTRGLFDPTTGVYWGSDSFASPMAHPGPPRRRPRPRLLGRGHPHLRPVHQPVAHVVDAAKFQRTVDRIEALQPQVLAGCHTPAIDGSYVAEAIAATRTAPVGDGPAPARPVGARRHPGSPAARVSVGQDVFVWRTVRSRIPSVAFSAVSGTTGQYCLRSSATPAQS